MAYSILYAHSAIKDLQKLTLKDAQRITKKIGFYATQKNPLEFAKPLTESKVGQYRFRIGDYRALFDINAKGQVSILMILRVKHRKDIYDL